jgi:hypothetical protein
MSTEQIMLITALIVSAFWAGVIGIVMLMQSYREDAVTEEIRFYVDRLIGPTAESGHGRHHLRG